MSEQNQHNAQNHLFCDEQRCFFIVYVGIFLSVNLKDAPAPAGVSSAFMLLHLNVAVQAAGCGFVSLFVKSGRSRWSLEMFPHQKTASGTRGNTSKNRCFCQTYLRCDRFCVGELEV